MRIGVLAASSRTNPAAIAKMTAYAATAFPEVELVFHPQCLETDGHFAGSDFRRAAAFLEYANDPAFDAIWFLRGGYGSNRILAMVMPELGRAARHKTYLGYSDVGFLLGALYARRIGRPVHGPMVSDINRHDGEATVARALGWMVQPQYPYLADRHAVVARPHRSRADRRGGVGGDVCDRPHALQSRQRHAA
jgi:muramoyltetrapeptide carboxypeptidase